MRFLAVWGLVLGGLLSAGCKKQGPSPGVVLETDVIDTWNGSFEASASPYGPLTMYLPTSRINSASVDTCRRHRLTTAQLQAADLQQATLTLEAPAGQNFDFLRQLTIYIMSGQGNDRVPLATLASVPLGATTLTLTPAQAPLLAYLRGGDYYLTPYLELRQPGQAFARVRLQLRFHIRAQQL